MKVIFFSNSTTVKIFVVSDQLKASSTEIFLNLVTLEDSAFTIKLNERGFEVVGNSLDTNNSEGWVHFCCVNILCPVLKVGIEKHVLSGIGCMRRLTPSWTTSLLDTDR